MSNQATQKAVRIKDLRTPTLEQQDFDPGRYFSNLTFYEAETPLIEQDIDGLAQFLHLLGYMALSTRSSAWQQSTVEKSGSAYQALRTHFGQRPWWASLDSDKPSISYRALIVYLMDDYPPHQ